MSKPVCSRCQLLSFLVERRPGGPDKISDFGRLLLLDSYHLAQVFCTLEKKDPSCGIEECANLAAPMGAWSGSTCQVSRLRTVAPWLSADLCPALFIGPSRFLIADYTTVSPP